MNTQDIIRTIITTILLIVLQVMLVRNLILWDVALCFIYIMAILNLPGEMNTTVVLLTSFVIGLTVDMFYNTAGVHASACLVIGFLRKSIITSRFPSKGLENEVDVSLEHMGPLRYFEYILIMTLFHHFVLFFLEAGGFSYFLLTSAKVFASLVFTSITIFLLSIFANNLNKS